MGMHAAELYTEVKNIYFQLYGRREAPARLGTWSNCPKSCAHRPDRRPGQEPTASLTLDAYMRLKAELEQLTTEGRADITEKIKIAREHGDIRENAEYDAAKNEQGMMESKIRKIQQMLRDPDIVEAPTEARTRSAPACSSP